MILHSFTYSFHFMRDVILSISKTISLSSLRNYVKIHLEDSVAHWRDAISLGQLLDYIATVSVLGELDELSDGGLVAKRDAPAIRERLPAHAATAREHMMVNEQVLIAVLRVVRGELSFERLYSFFLGAVVVELLLKGRESFTQCFPVSEVIIILGNIARHQLRVMFKDEALRYIAMGRGYNGSRVVNHIHRVPIDFFHAATAIAIAIAIAIATANAMAIATAIAIAIATAAAMAIAIAIGNFIVKVLTVIVVFVVAIH